MYHAIDEPTLITYRGLGIGTFVPIAVPEPLAGIGRGVAEYRPEPTIELELAKVAMEAASALSEAESLRDLVCPDPTGVRRGVARENEYLRRRIHLARLREQHAKEQT
jgi:hypothetical protein